MKHLMSVSDLQRAQETASVKDPQNSLKAHSRTRQLREQKSTQCGKHLEVMGKEPLRRWTGKTNGGEKKEVKVMTA